MQRYVLIMSVIWNQKFEVHKFWRVRFSNIKANRSRAAPPLPSVSMNACYCINYFSITTHFSHLLFFRKYIINQNVAISNVLSDHNPLSLFIVRGNRLLIRLSLREQYYPSNASKSSSINFTENSHCCWHYHLGQNWLNIDAGKRTKGKNFTLSTTPTLILIICLDFWHWTKREKEPISITHSHLHFWSLPTPISQWKRQTMFGRSQCFTRGKNYDYNSRRWRRIKSKDSMCLFIWWRSNINQRTGLTTSF